jgi:hypothetical protein
MMTRPFNPHDAHLRTGWRLCRFGWRALSAPDQRAAVEAWLSRMDGVVPGSPHLDAWRRILAGDAPEMAGELETVEDYFALTPGRQGVWRPLVQSQPFSCLLPGRSTRDRRTVLSRLP